MRALQSESFRIRFRKRSISLRWCLLAELHTCDQMLQFQESVSARTSLSQFVRKRSPLEKGQLPDRLAENQVHDRSNRETRVHQTQADFDRSVRDQLVKASENVEHFRSRRGADKDPAARGRVDISASFDGMRIAPG